MVHWPAPRNIKEFKGFLGLTGHYRRFVMNYGLIAAPLTQLLRQDAFQWSKQAEKAFIPLKQAMVSFSVLPLPDFSQLFVIETDASGLVWARFSHKSKGPLLFLVKPCLLGPN